MKKTFCVALLLLISFEANAAIVYTQPPSLGGGLLPSSRWDPDGSDFDQYVWDNFTLSSVQAITEIDWRGGFDLTIFGSSGAVSDFTVSIYASIPGGLQPDVVNPPLVQYHTGGNAGQSPAGTFGGIPMYDYKFTLPVPFRAAAGSKYWVQIEAMQHGIPSWGIARGTNGDGTYFRRIAGVGDFTYQIAQGNASFTLKAGVPGIDFDGDGETDIAIWDPSNGIWYIVRSSDGMMVFTPWGGGNDVPVPGDYDGDGKTDIAIWRPSNGYWYILRSSDGTMTLTKWGVQNQIPLSQ